MRYNFWITFFIVSLVEQGKPRAAPPHPQPLTEGLGERGRLPCALQDHELMTTTGPRGPSPQREPACFPWGESVSRRGERIPAPFTSCLCLLAQRLAGTMDLFISNPCGDGEDRSAHGGHKAEPDRVSSQQPVTSVHSQGQRNGVGPPGGRDPQAETHPFCECQELKGSVFPRGQRPPTQLPSQTQYLTHLQTTAGKEYGETPVPIFPSRDPEQTGAELSWELGFFH